MKLSALGALLLAGCASSGQSGMCGAAAPVEVVVDSNQFADVVIRDAEGRRLGTAYGNRVSRFRFCSYGGMVGRFMLDPIGGAMGYVLDGGMSPTPGSVVLMSLGSNLRISFAQVVPPAE